MPATVELIVRLGAFALVFVALALWELLGPRRGRSFGRWRRWPHNLGILVADIVVLRVLVPTAAVGAALYAAGQGYGLFNWLQLRLSVGAALGFLMLDLAVWAQHVAFHRLPWLWRVHRMHHTDLDVDVTTGIRFHPIEILISLGIKMAVIVALGVPPVGVLIFEIVLNAAAMFNHSNVRIAPGVDRVLRWLLVTPDMHRIHHSVERHETDSNFGFSLSWWDRLFGTYRRDPQAGHDRMVLGVPEFRDPSELRIDRMLTHPFRTETLPRRGDPNTALGEKSGPV